MAQTGKSIWLMVAGDLSVLSETDDVGDEIVHEHVVRASLDSCKNKSWFC